MRPVKASKKKCSFNVRVETIIRIANMDEKNLIKEDLNTEKRIHTGSTVKATCMEGKQA